jgi:chromate reductase, NAD(P)H dehydrogenase (quinone)
MDGGKPGAMKNALVWMVGNESFVDKPIALLNASPRDTIAQHPEIRTARLDALHVLAAAVRSLPPEDDT